PGRGREGPGAGVPGGARHVVGVLPGAVRQRRVPVPEVTAPGEPERERPDRANPKRKRGGSGETNPVARAPGSPNPDTEPLMFSRRTLLKTTASGFGYLAFAALAHEQAARANPAANPLAPKAPHLPPRAKRVIFLC